MREFASELVVIFNMKNNLKETLACVGIISGLNCLLSGLINKSIYDKYSKSLQKDCL